MSQYQMGPIESRFADLIWEKAPVTAAELARETEALLGWKKTTTYTVLKRLCEKGIFQNKDRIITSLIAREEFYALQSEKFVEETFAGSLPAFLAAFTTRKALTPEEIAQIRSLIDGFEEG